MAPKGHLQPVSGCVPGVALAGVTEFDPGGGLIFDRHSGAAAASPDGTDCVGRTANASAMDGASLSSALTLDELQQRHWFIAVAEMTALD